MTNTKRQHKHADGTYHINGKKFPVLVGSRAQVWHHTAFKTPGGLTRKGLLKNKHGNRRKKLQPPSPKARGNGINALRRLKQRENNRYGKK